LFDWSATNAAVSHVSKYDHEGIAVTVTLDEPSGETTHEEKYNLSLQTTFLFVDKFAFFSTE
jgi:hypothetical protein